MKNNYFKSFLKAYGIIPTILTFAILAMVGFVLYGKTQIIGNQMILEVANGAVLVLFVGSAVVGLSKLKGEKISFIDFLRVVFLLSSIFMTVFVAVNEGFGMTAILYMIVAIIFLLQCIVRARFADDAVEESTFKNYFGALAGCFNPIIIMILSIALAVAGYFAAQTNLLGSISFIGNIADYKYIFVGAMVAAIVLLILPAIDKEADVTLIDFFLAILFIASLYLMFVTMNEVSSTVFKMLILLVGGSGAGMLIRALCYNKGKGYSNSAHKQRTYFKEVYETYDVTLPILVGCLLVLFLGLPVALLGNNPVSKMFGGTNDTLVTVCAICALVLIVLMLGLVIVFRNFSSRKVVKTDWVLVAMLFGSSYVIPFAITAILNKGGEMDVLTANPILLVAFIAYIVLLVIALAVQFIRLRNFDPLHQLVGDAKPYYVKKEEPVEEEEEEVEEDAEKPENNDPFALTEEDEALYENYYGVDEEEEEVVEEVVEEEVEYEEVEYEEVEYEEVEYVEEEVVEEQPVEEVTESAAEEEAEEADEEDEDEAEEEDEAEYEEEEIEEVEEVEVKKESGVIVNDFTLVDEEGKPKKIKRKFNSKMMFAPYETKEYYNEIKNYLMMYRAKGRYSSRCETFRYKGLVAKVALGGKSIKVFLALDPEFIAQNPKYHLKDVSEKRQYAEVPAMLKVRSPRGLKYFKELVDIMMATRLVKPKRNYQPTNFLPQLIPNGEAILATLGMSTDYLHNMINVRGIPEEMPNDLIDYIPMIPAEPLEEEEVEASIYLDTLCNHFDDGAEITLDILKELRIVNRGNVLRIRARGTLDRKLIIYAEKFDEDALKMLMCTSCTAIRIIRDEE